MLARGFGRNRLARQQHFHRLLARHVARQRHHRRRAEQADIDARRGKARCVRGNREIATGDELAAGGGGNALHGGDHRLGQMHHRLHHGAAGVHELGEVGTAAIGIAAARGHFLHVMAGGEGGTIGRDDEATHALVGADLVQRRMKLRDQSFRQAVARRGTVEGEHGNAADIFAQQNWADQAERRGRSGASKILPA